MNRSKYYTPEIGEFCVGFEFEFQGLDNYWNPTGWEKVKLNTNESKNFGLYTLKHIKSVLEDKEVTPADHVRVKYLDKEDIESLGFTFFAENNENLVNSSVNMYHNDGLNLMLGHYYNLGQIVIATKDPSKNETFSKTGQDPNRTGFLKIKNKTELIKLLKQLDINYGI